MWRSQAWAPGTGEVGGGESILGRGEGGRAGWGWGGYEPKLQASGPVSIVLSDFTYEDKFKGKIIKNINGNHRALNPRAAPS